MALSTATALAQNKGRLAALDAARAAKSQDDAFLEINARYRGFAGIHLENGRGVVSVTSSATAADVAELAALAFELGLEVGEIESRVVQFEFAELSRLRDELSVALAFGGGAHASTLAKPCCVRTTLAQGSISEIVVVLYLFGTAS